MIMDRSTSIPPAFLFLFLICAPFMACTYDVASTLEPPAVLCDTLTAVTYSNTIRPILDAHCAVPGCHVTGGEGTGNFTTYAGIYGQVTSGALIPSIEWAPDAIAMPPQGDPLSDCDIAKIVIWVNAGAPEN